MSTIILSAIGGAIGNSFMGMIGQFIGSELGAALGSKIDSALFGLNNTKYGPRLENLNIQTSTYGTMIPIVYGTARIAGNVIWAQQIKEVPTKDAKIASDNILRFGATNTYVSYSYFATLAIGICKGKIEDVTKIWADTKLLTANEINFRLYKGTEDQEPDPLIISIEGSSPAYRGLAYIVIEDFPLADYGNRIPNFTFEVTSSPKTRSDQSSVAARIKNINLIPGSGEFVYDTKVQMKIAQEDIGDKSITYGAAQRVNQHNYSDETDFMLSLKQLKTNLPNVEWVSVVVNWFASSLNVKDCKMYPAAEFQYDAITTPNDWQVGEITRSKAKLISKDNHGNPRYGGTVSDSALLRCIEELRSRGYKVMLYPMLLMDIPGKPWRGYLTGLPEEINNFFIEYNKFILHYCAISKIDGIIIGSEFTELTKIKDSDGNYPAVIELMKLAQQVKQKVKDNVIITYAADWTEYHSSDGWYNMDDLWSSDYIDVVGIDAYFPLTDGREPTLGYTKDDIAKGWTSGEGYDYFYLDANNKTGKTNYTDNRFAWKNIEEWWSKHHINPDGKMTKWQPKMKKIWFTEYGFPSVDGCANQPNTFIDQSSIDSKYPHYSQGNVDFYTQRIAIDGTLTKWHGSEMVEKMFLWAWDARPYPYFPDLCSVWADCHNWQTGHWIQGKISLLGIDAVLADVLQKSGVDERNFDVSQLRWFLHGYVINQIQSARSIIQILQNAYFFDVIEQDYKLLFIHRGKEANIHITIDDVVPDIRYNEEKLLNIERTVELAHKINVIYISRVFDYQIGIKYAQFPNSNSIDNGTMEVPLILEENQAQNIAEVMLYNSWQERNLYNFTLSIKYAWLSPSDIIKILDNKKEHILRITKIKLGSLSLQIEGVSYNSSIYKFSFPPTKIATAKTNLPKHPSNTHIEILDLPYLYNGGENLVKFVVGGIESNWRGATIFMSENNGQSYKAMANVNQSSTYGFVVNRLGIGPVAVFDESSAIEVILNYGKLLNANHFSILNGANLALVGNEIIQFCNAESIGNNRYKLNKLLRGKFDTEKYISYHQAGERFILLNELVTEIKINPSMIGRSLLFKAVTYGRSVDDTEALAFKLPDRV